MLVNNSHCCTVIVVKYRGCTCAGVVLEFVAMATDTAVASRCVFTATVGAGVLTTLIDVYTQSQPLKTRVSEVNSAKDTRIFYKIFYHSPFSIFHMKCFTLTNFAIMIILYFN